MNHMRNHFGFVSLLDQRSPREPANPYWYLCRLSLTAWAKHLAEVSRSRGSEGPITGDTNSFAEAPEKRHRWIKMQACTGSHSAISSV